MNIPKKLEDAVILSGHINAIIDCLHAIEARLPKPEALKLKYPPFVSTGRYVDLVEGEYRTYHEVVVKFDTEAEAKTYREQLLTNGVQV